MLLLLLSCFSRVRLCATPETEAHQAPLSLGFSSKIFVPLPPDLSAKVLGKVLGKDAKVHWRVSLCGVWENESPPGSHLL